MTTPSEEEARALIQELRMANRSKGLAEDAPSVEGRAAETIAALASRVSTPPSEDGGER